MSELFHEGVIRKSGRYPWGSGANPYQRSVTFLSTINELKAKGMSDVEIARSFHTDDHPFTTSDLREMRTIARAQKSAADQATAMRLKEKDWSNVAIGERMGIPESSVRALLKKAMDDRADVLVNTANHLRQLVEEKGMLDVGTGVEHYLGVARTKLNAAIASLKEEGYVEHKFSEKQAGRETKTNYKVLTKPGTTYPDVLNNLDKIGSVTGYSEDGGRSFLNVLPPAPVNAKRIEVRYAEDGGTDMDGVIQLRRGVEDLSLGQARYAQVRIQVGDGHYLKGMAMYADDLPDGVDIRFNTNKSPTGNKLDAMKPLKVDKATGEIDQENPFGSVIRQRHYLDSKGKRKLSPLNIVGSENPDNPDESTSGEEGGWSKWSSKLSSQMLSKQKPQLAKEQLELTYNVKKSDYDEIMSLTNPTVKRKLLETFAESSDSSAKHLKAAGLPRTKNHVILPINTLKDDEIYAPWYKDGETVVLIRHPHGGIFEIPELRVNNKNREANSLIKNAADAVGINSKVAARLSGADFDGDTVLVIPNNSRKVQTRAPLEDLQNFEPKSMYPKYPGMKVMTNTQQEMGQISNLITDMTIKDAPWAEIARAVRHSMVVIDAEKHELNYRQSAIDNRIAELKTRYQGGPNAGADTLISQAKSKERIPARRLARVSEGGPIDRATGRKVYVNTGETYTNAKGKVITKEVAVPKMDLVDDARTLMSNKGQGTTMERIYADHANRLKDLANTARREALATPNLRSSPSAKATYKSEVETLKAKLTRAQRNAPRERQAQLVARSIVKTRRQADPSLDKGDIKKLEQQALAAARRRAGAKKELIDITPLEWEAIQAGAVSNTMLGDILNHTDLDLVRQYALPRESTVMSDARLARARNMLNNGYTPADIAEALGVAPSTLSSALDTK